MRGALGAMAADYWHAQVLTSVCPSLLCGWWCSEKEQIKRLLSRVKETEKEVVGPTSLGCQNKDSQDAETVATCPGLPAAHAHQAGARQASGDAGEERAGGGHTSGPGLDMAPMDGWVDGRIASSGTA